MSQFRANFSRVIKFVCSVWVLLASDGGGCIEWKCLDGLMVKLLLVWPHLLCTLFLLLVSLLGEETFDYSCQSTSLFTDYPFYLLFLTTPNVLEQHFFIYYNCSLPALLFDLPPFLISHHLFRETIWWQVDSMSGLNLRARFDTSCVQGNKITFKFWAKIQIQMLRCSIKLLLSSSF